jgi:hypothetical protein
VGGQISRARIYRNFYYLAAVKVERDRDSGVNLKLNELHFSSSLEI